MADRFLKSTIWIASFGGVAYLLQLLTEPSAEKLERIRSTSAHLTEDEKKKILILKRLKEAANIDKKDQ